MATINISGSLLPSSTNTPLDARTVVNSLDDLSSVKVPYEGLLIYVKDIDEVYSVTSVQRDEKNQPFIDKSNLKLIGSGGGASVYFSEDGITPEDINVIWVDGADQQMLDASTFDKIRTELNKLDNRLNNIEYAFDVSLDSGDITYYKGSEIESIPGVKPDSNFDIVLNITYDGDVFTFKRTDDNEDLSAVSNKIEFKNNNEVVAEYTYDDDAVNFTVNNTYEIHAMNFLAFDTFTLYNNDEIVYQCEISSASLLEDFSWADRLQPNVHHICIKRAPNRSLLGEYPIKDGELVYSKSDNKLYIGNDGRLAEISGSGSGGSTGNITATYIDLVASDNSSITYRITINSNGELIIKNKEYYEGEDQQPLEAGKRNLPGLVIDMIYAGPSDANATSDNICSHSFIELYNATVNDINLKGCSICIGVNTWDYIIPLYGIIPAKGYFLVRLNPVSNPSSSTTRVNIDEFDLDAYAENNSIKLTSDGFKVYLQIGNEKPTIDSPWSINNSTIDSTTIGYIDLVGCMGQNADDDAKVVNAGEFAKGTTAQSNAVVTEVRGIYRNYIDSLDVNGAKNSQSPCGDSNNNIKDFRPFDYSTNYTKLSNQYIADTTVMFKPKTSKDKSEGIYRFKTKFDPTKPNMPTMCIGEAPTTRTFTWISIPLQEECIFYKKSGTGDWVSVNSELSGDYARQRITADDGQVYTVHKAFVRNLTAGNYTWMCGTKDATTGGSYKSDEYTFKVTEASLDQTSGAFTFCQVSDQQGWAFNEYDPWSIAISKIVENFNAGSTSFPNSSSTGFEWLLNTGDMSQNGSRPSEWLDYYNAGSKYLPNLAQMNCVGNNDLCPGKINNQGTTGQKVLPTTFEYYYTYEYSNNEEERELQQVSDGFMKSVYAFDYGCAHFVCLNSNGASTITNTQGNCIEEQKAWFKKHMDNVKAREVQPKWIIVYMHDAPFNQLTRRPGHNLPEYNLTLGTAYNVRTGLRDSAINQESYPGKQFTWSRLLEDYGVDLVLSGHKHTYTRSYPLRENTVDPNLLDPEINTQSYPVNPWEPLYTEDTANRMVMNGEEEVGKGITYVMCQATGYKLQSNKDVPVDGIKWLANYFPGTPVSGQENATVNRLQKAPTFIIWKVTPDTLSMEAYQLINLTTGSQWDHMNNGEVGTTQISNIQVNKIDSVTLNQK